MWYPIEGFGHIKVEYNEGEFFINRGSSVVKKVQLTGEAGSSLNETMLSIIDEAVSM